MKYGEIDCLCGKAARVVECFGLGVYVRCPHCGRDTMMQNTKEEAEKIWKEKMDEEQQTGKADKKSEGIN